MTRYKQKQQASSSSPQLPLPLLSHTHVLPYLPFLQASKIAKKAHKEGTTLIEAGGPKGLNYYTEEQFAQWVRPEMMIGPTKPK